MPLETFYLGTHQPHWLRHTGVPLFVSRRRLARLKSLPRALGPWALDSGGFSELSLFGRWAVSAEEYAQEVRRYRREVGNLAAAFGMDYMCEPEVLRKTGLSVAEHQRRTLENFLRLRELAPEVPWAPVLQGWAIGEYISHARAYREAGIDLRACVLVGVGSVCRRQHSAAVGVLFRELGQLGAALHGFGLKAGGLRLAAGYLTSADSLAWSYAARRRPPPVPCPEGHRRCNNCLRFALRWREALLASVTGEVTPHQQTLWRGWGEGAGAGRGPRGVPQA